MSLAPYSSEPSAPAGPSGGCCRHGHGCSFVMSWSRWPLGGTWGGQGSCVAATVGHWSGDRISPRWPDDPGCLGRRTACSAVLQSTSGVSVQAGTGRRRAGPRGARRDAGDVCEALAEGRRRAGAPASPTPGRRPHDEHGRRSRRTGRTWAATRSPTASSHARTRRRPRPDRRRPQRPHDAVEGRRRTGRRAGRRRHGRRGPSARAVRPRSRRRHAVDDPQRRSGRGRRRQPPAVVMTIWPAGRCERAAPPAGGRARTSTSSSTSTGVEPVRSATRRWAPRRRARASVRCSPCEAWVRAGSPSMDSSSSSRCGPTVDTPRAGRRRGRRPAPRPARCAATAGRTSGRPRRRRPAARRPRRRAAEPLDQRRPGVAEPLAGLGELGVPHVERRRPSSSSRPPTCAAACCAGARCGRARAGSASYLTASATSVSSRKRRRSAGPPFTSVRSSGENTVTRPRRAGRAPARRWRLTCTGCGPAGRARPRSATAGRRRRAARRARRRSRADPHQRLGRRAAEAGQRGRGRPAPRRSSSCPAVVADDDASCRREVERRRGVVAEVDELEPLDDHGRGRRPIRAPGPASAGTGSRRGRRRG